MQSSVCWAYLWLSLSPTMGVPSSQFVSFVSIGTSHLASLSSYNPHVSRASSATSGCLARDSDAVLGLSEVIMVCCTWTSDWYERWFRSEIVDRSRTAPLSWNIRTSYFGQMHQWLIFCWIIPVSCSNSAGEKYMLVVIGETGYDDHNRAATVTERARIEFSHINIGVRTLPNFHSRIFCFNAMAYSIYSSLNTDQLPGLTSL